MSDPDYLVTVCRRCLTASCWHGEFMCTESKSAGTREIVASLLRRWAREHESNFSVEKLMQVCGSVKYVSAPDYKTLYLDLVGRLEGWAVQLDAKRDNPGDVGQFIAAELRNRMAVPDNLPRRETSASIAQWQRETFGEATTTYERATQTHDKLCVAMSNAVMDVSDDPSKERPNLSRAIRAAEELAELIELLVNDDAAPKAPEECADIDIVLRGIDDVHKVERADVVDGKMAINRARKWQLTGDGHGQHVEEGK